MWYRPYKSLLWKIALSILAGSMLYASFSKYEAWYLSPLAFFILYVLEKPFLWFLSGFLFFFLSLRCASIAAVEFGRVDPFLFYALFFPLSLLLGFFQFYLPAKLRERFFGSKLWVIPPLYIAFEVFRSYFPYGGFPWLIVGSLSVYVPLLRDSLLFSNVYVHSLLFLTIPILLIKRKFVMLASVLLFFMLLGGMAILIKDRRLQESESIRVALIQTAVPQEDKLDREAFRAHAPAILELVERALEHKPDLVVLPESAFHFFNDETEDEFNIRLRELSLHVPIVVGLIEIREGSRPFNSAYLLRNGMEVGFYDKVKLFPIGEYMPFPFDFLKRFFPAISGIDYVPGDRLKALEYEKIRLAVPICFEVAYFTLVRELAERANLIAVLTNDGWFRDSDCTHQHYLWARVRALENAKYLLWVNNSGDTGVIDPFGKVVERMPYMKRGVVLDEVRLLH